MKRLISFSKEKISNVYLFFLAEVLIIFVAELVTPSVRLSCKMYPRVCAVGFPFKILN